LGFNPPSQQLAVALHGAESGEKSIHNDIIKIFTDEECEEVLRSLRHNENLN
jgi:hypothetical protein